MSRLSELLERLCPEGVEYKSLGEIGTFVRGHGLQKKDLTESGVPCIHYGQIYTYYGTFVHETKSFVSEDAAKKFKKAKTGDLVIACTSENVEDVCKCVAWLGKENVCVSGEIYIFRHDQNPKYLAYYLQTSVFQSFKQRNYTGTKVIRIHEDKLGKFVIPVPPIEVQEEIVRILDKFTTLEAELEAELEARRKQYEYYRDKLLSFGETENGGRPIEVKWLNLGDICMIKGRIGFRGYTRQDLVEESEGAISLSPSNIVNGILMFDKCSYVSWSKYYESPEIMAEVGDIVFTKTASVGKSALIKRLPKETTINPQLVLLKNISCDSSFLAYVLKTAKIQNEVKKITGVGSVPNVPQSALENIRIPIPPIEEQRRIVGILDRFEKLTTDISEGLPAEIRARHRQYEYYRDRLLSFKRKTA